MSVAKPRQSTPESSTQNCPGYLTCQNSLPPKKSERDLALKNNSVVKHIRKSSSHGFPEVTLWHYIFGNGYNFLAYNCKASSLQLQASLLPMKFGLFAYNWSFCCLHLELFYVQLTFCLQWESTSSKYLKGQ